MSRQSSAPTRTDVDTMSGPLASSRTLRGHRLRLACGMDPVTSRWAQLSWRAAPAALELLLQDHEAGIWQPVGTVHLGDSQYRFGLADLNRALSTLLPDAGCHAQTCGACRDWRPFSEQGNEDGIDLGQCGLEMAPQMEQEQPNDCYHQSCLSPDCMHWREADSLPTAVPAWQPTAAALRVDRPSLWRRIVAHLRSSRRNQHHDRTVPIGLSAAGTEACLVCRGRMANCGSLTIAATEGDKRTLSLWRCRLCLTWFLNDWTDRWERLSSLETEERIYRLAPFEAEQVLSTFAAVPNGAHPQGRHQREAERLWIENLVAGRPHLSHQVKHGR